MFLATQGSTPASQPAGGQRALRSLRPRPVIDFPDGGRAGRAIYGRCGTRKSGGPAGSGRRRRSSSKTRGGRLVGHTTRGWSAPQLRCRTCSCSDRGHHPRSHPPVAAGVYGLLGIYRIRTKKDPRDDDNTLNRASDQRRARFHLHFNTCLIHIAAPIDS